MWLSIDPDPLTQSPDIVLPCGRVGDHFKSLLYIIGEI